MAYLIEHLFFMTRFPKKLQEKSLSSSPVMEEILDWYQKQLNVDDAADTWFQTSVQDYAVYDKLQGHQEWGWKSGGYATVLDLLMVSCFISQYTHFNQICSLQLPRELCR